MKIAWTRWLAPAIWSSTKRKRIRMRQKGVPCETTLFRMVFFCLSRKILYMVFASYSSKLSFCPKFIYFCLNLVFYSEDVSCVFVEYFMNFRKKRAHLKKYAIIKHNCIVQRGSSAEDEKGSMVKFQHGPATVTTSEYAASH